MKKLWQSIPRCWTYELYDGKKFYIIYYFWAFGRKWEVYQQEL